MNKTKKFAITTNLFLSIIIFLILFILIISKNRNMLKIDESVAQMLYNHRKRFLDYIFVIISYFGETLTIASLCFILVLLPNRKQIGLPVAMLTAISFAINFVLKLIVARHRPENLFLTQDTLGYKMPDGYSFPSGHAQTANLFYFVLSFLILNKTSKKWLGQLLIASNVLFCFFMCIARIYLCVHYLSDILCGVSIMNIIFCSYLLITEINFEHKYFGHE